MDRYELTQHCHQLVEQLNQQHGWDLDIATREQYATRVMGLSSSREVSEAMLASMIGYFHTEHILVDALSEPEHTSHHEAWRLVERQLRTLLASKLAGNSPEDAATSLDDLVQEAVADVWRGLHRFRYQSRLQTWIFTIASNCLNRAIRTRRAHKRVSAATAQSLDAIIEMSGDNLPARPLFAPDELAQGRALGSLIKDILSRHPDRRLATILQLWAVEDQSLREIGSRLDLSVSRVHGLLIQAQTLLGEDPSLQDWHGRSAETTAAIRGSSVSPDQR